MKPTAGHRPRASAAMPDAWAEPLLTRPLQNLLQQSQASPPPTTEDVPELVLHHPDVCIRSSHRSSLGTWIWRPRHVALVRPRAGDSAAVLLLYDAAALLPGGPPLPTGAARLTLGSTATLVPDHPRHVELRSSLDHDMTLSFAGAVDAPRRKTTAGADGTPLYAWRLRLPTAEAARMWRDVLAGAVQMQARRSSPPRRAASGSSAAVSAGSRRAATLRLLAILLAICCLGILGRLATASVARASELLNRLAARGPPLGETTAELQRPEKSPKVPSAKWASRRIRRLGNIIFRRAPLSTGHDLPAAPTAEALPAPWPTPYRRLLGLFANHAGSLARVQFWLALLAAAVLAVSASSLARRALPARLRPSARFARALSHGSAATALSSLALALAHDACVNGLVSPLRYGLYWRGWFQSLAALGLLGRARTAARRAWGLQTTSQLSRARATSAGVAGGAVTAGVPLALRGFSAARDGRTHEALTTWAGALLVPLVGLYFLGRALRRMTAFGGVPVGMYLHRFSLLPARFCYAVLSFVGDAAKVVLGYTRREASKTFYRAWYGLVRLVAPAWQLFPLLRDSAQWAAEKCLDFGENIGRSLKRLLSSACHALRHHLFSLIAILKVLWESFVLPGLQALQTASAICFDGAIQLGRLAVGILSPTRRAIVQYVLSPICIHIDMLVRSCVLSGLRALRMGTVICRDGAIQFGSWAYRASVEYVFHPFYSRLTSVFRNAVVIIGPPITAMCNQFVKRYWKLVPTSLILNGALVFVKASMSPGTNAISMVQYLLGAWALLLVGLTMANTVFLTGDNLMRQHVDIADSAYLPHVDLHVGYAVTRITQSGWHALSTVLRLVLHAIDILIRRSCGRLWNAIIWLHEHAAMRVYNGVRCLFKAVWNSPVAGMVVSSSALCTIYLLNHGVVRVPSLLFSTKLRLTAFRGYFEVLSTSFLGFSTVLDPLKPPLLFMAKFFWKTYWPVVGVESSSPSSAFACWGFSCIIKLTCHRVRLKIFVIPALCIYIPGVADEDLFRVFFVSFAAWVILSSLVDQYETEQSRLADQALPSFLSERRPVRLKDRVSQQTRKRSQQSDCSICLESLDNAGSDLTKVALPCGHAFHKACIEDWLHIQSRCPVCRRAAHGFDRVLEVVF